MPKFVPRSDFDPHPKAPNRYLDEVRASSRDILALYREQVPDGADYTLFVLAAIGEKRAAALASGDIDSAKKAIGYMVAVDLAEMFGADKVFSERDDKGRAHSRPNDSGLVTWVANYTRHRVVT